MTEAGGKTKAARWRGYAINIALFAIVIFGVRAWQQRDMVSGPAPALHSVLAGKPYTLPAHPRRPVLVHFWATWCPVCRTELGSIAAIAEDHPDTVTIAMQSGQPQEVAAYLRAQGVDFPVVNDADGSLASGWGVHALPASFIIAPDGQIRFIEVGYTTELGLRLRLWLAGF